MTWMHLVPSGFPEKSLTLTVDANDLLDRTRTFDFGPFCEVHAGNSDRLDLVLDSQRWFINPGQFDTFRSGANTYTFFAIVIGPASVEFRQSYDDSSSELHDTTMRLLRFLIDGGEMWTWHAISGDPDSGDGSDPATGGLTELVALVSGD